MLKMKKMMSIVLIVFLLTSVLPVTANADQVSVNKASTQNVQTEKVKKKKVGKITKELTEQRTINSKKYEKDDGSYEVAEYKTPIHYLDNGKWEDIDNSLQDSKDDGYLENKQNDFKIEISKNSSTQKLVDLKKDKYEVSWNLENANAAQGSVVSPNDDEINNDIDKSADDQISKDKDISSESASDKQDAKNILVSNEKVKTLKNITSTVNFSNIFSNTDLQYILKGSDVKENIVINKPSDNAVYKFNLNVKNVTPVLQQDKSIIFYDSNDKTKAVFKIAAPVMYDKAGQSSDNIDIKLNQTEDGYELIITPDNTWLDSSDRVYPVTIDPSMQTSLDVDSIHDTFVCSNDTSNKSQNEFVRVGQTPDVGLTRTYIKFDLPQLSAGDMITSADLNLLLCSSVSKISGNQINVHNVTQDNNPSTINWASQPSYDPHVEALSVVNSNQDQWVNWDITSIAKQWFTTGNNYGLMLEEDNGSGYSAFWSSDVDNSYSWARPQVTFNYINNTGLEDYWTYHSQSVGRAGTSYVNDYNGNLVFTHSDIDMNGSRMPVSINHVFNSNDRNTDVGTGDGWRLNLNERLEQQNISGVNYYKYTDEDGTRHYFKDTGAAQFSDELNLGLTLTKETDGTLSIKDKKDNKIDFNASTCDLNYIKDANGNTMTFAYGSGNVSGVRNLTKVTDGAGRVVSLNYTGSLLTSIVDSANRTTYYNYDGNGNMTSITYPDGKTCTYSYDGNHNLVSATNYDGYKISYQYYGIAPYRVSDVLESNTDGTLGDELSINYGNNSTTFTDVKSRKNVYEFDNSGETLCIKDSDGSAEYYEHGDATNATKLTSESKVEKTVVNLLTNHELETTDGWSASSDGGNGTSIFTTEASYLGHQSIKITKTDNVSRQYYDQWNNLTKGKTYTFSGYVKTVGVSNTNGNGAALSFYYKDKSGVYQHVDSKYINGTNDWQRIQVSFTLPNDASDTNVLTRLSMLQESGTAYFDSLQLEEGSIANRYNLIENGDLTGTSGTPNKWSASGTSGSDGLVTVTDSDHPINLDDNVYQVNGVYGVEKRLGQSVNVSGKAGDIYTLGTWGKAYSVPSGTFQIQAAFITSNGPQWVTFDFNKASNDWQYVSGECIAKSDYSRIDVYYLYKDNANTAYFDGAQLYKEQFGKSYQYDSNGNIVSTASLAQQNSTFQYNGNNDLVQSIDPKGNSFNYQYDSKHNLTRATSSENVNYSFNYDSNGNPISSRVGDGTDYIQSKADYTASGNYIKSLTDSLGNTVNYNYDETKGLLTSVTDAKGSTTNNGYDGMDNLTSTSKTVDGQQVTNSYSYQNDKISQITHNGFNYNFGYDSLGNNTTVAVGNQNLITNTYEPRTSVLLKSTYGNGQSVSTDYDNLDRVTGKVVGGDSSVGVCYAGQVQHIGWQSPVNDYNMAGTTGQGLRLEALKINLTTPIAGMRIKYQAHVENIGWQDWVYDGNVAGTVGQGLRMEAIKIQLEGAPAGYTVRYQVHVQGLGWMDPVKDGEMAGTTGQGRRIEAIKISVEKPRYTYQYDAAGNLASENDFINNVTNNYVYDNSNRLVKTSDSNGNELDYNYDLNNNINSLTDKVNNTTHTTNYTYDKDNKLTATTYGNSEDDNNYDSLGRLTSSAIKTGTAQYNVNYGYLPGAMSSNIGVSYNGYVQNSGWQGTKTDGETSGTVGQGLEYQQVNMNLTNVPSDTSNPLSNLKIQYQTHVSNIGWQAPVYGGTVAGTLGSNYEIQAIKINLVGAPAGYHVWYQAQVESLGWMDPVEDGNVAGTTGQHLRLEALRVYIVKPGADSKDSTKIGTINNNGNQISYTYDGNGNIKTITQNGQTITYTYNELNEVTREDNQVLNKTVVYSYDAGGNITNKVQYSYTTGNLGTATSTINYGYGDSNWKDKLTSYNGKTITYDAIGNPLNDGTYNYTWEEGRQLSGISGNGQTIAYKYNDDGIRTQKTVNGVTTNYRLEGDKVTYETDGTNQIYYTYDSAGKLLSMNLNGTEYYYIYNAQGDIIGLFDKTGTQVVSYSYDTWGKLISIGGSLASTVGAENPYRYRGYRYDTETGLYYLQSRYYNPEWGRFINADAIGGKVGELLSHNIFAYCRNNPVNMLDVNGNWPLWLDSIVNAIVAVVSPSITAVVNIVNAVSSIVYSQMKDLGKGWYYRHDKGGKGTGEKEHVHVQGGGKKYQQAVDGTRRKLENPPGLPDPPTKVRQRLKEKEGWDWDANAAKSAPNYSVPVPETVTAPETVEVPVTDYIPIFP
jgi:RHS repeat-associated protein